MILCDSLVEKFGRRFRCMESVSSTDPLSYTRRRFDVELG